LDVTITQLINNLSGQNFVADQFFILITKYGVPFLVFAVVAQWWAGSPRPEARQIALNAGLTFLLGLGLAQIILLFMHRMRPYDAGISHLIVPPTVDWSFPSDHAIASLGIVFAYALSGFRRVAILFFIFAALICFSRIYVGMHYVSDIFGGALVALAAAVIVKRAYPASSKLNRWLIQIF